MAKNKSKLAEAFVLINAQLSPLKKALQKGMSMVKSVGRTMGHAFVSAWNKALKTAKWAGVGIGAILGLSARAAMKQEDAMFTLGAALKSVGEYSKGAMTDFSNFAKSIQDVTVYGDEEVLSLMRLMKSLGVATPKLKEASKQAIGLAAATNRDVQSMAMYIALAQQGEFTMLRRYIPALRSATSATEQMQIITEFAAAGFKIAEAQAETTSGALTQMKNAVGDVGEAIGSALLPGITKTAKAITKWAKDNERAIAEWSEVSVQYAEFVKGVLWDFVMFMRNDFGGAFTTGIRIAIDALLSLVDIAKIVAKQIGGVLAGGIYQVLSAMFQEAQNQGNRFLTTQLAPMVLAAAGVRDKFKRPMAEVGNDIADVFSELKDKIKKESPEYIWEGWSKRFEDAQSNIAAIHAKYAQKIQAENEKTQQSFEQITGGMSLHGYAGRYGASGFINLPTMNNPQLAEDKQQTKILTDIRNNIKQSNTYLGSMVRSGAIGSLGG